MTVPPPFALERFFTRHEFSVELDACASGTLIVPGSVYGHPGEHLRLGFGRRNFPGALARIEAVL